MIATLHDFDKTQTDILAQGGIIVAITPDDIITLKLWRDDRRNYVNPHRTNENERLLQTLERILRQIH